MPTIELPKDVQERLQRLDELEQRDLERRGEYEKSAKSAAERHKQELAKREERIAQLHGSLTKTLTTGAAMEAIQAAKGDFEALSPHVLPHLQVVEDTGKPGSFSVVVRDPKDPKKPRLSARGTEMTVRDLVGELQSHPAIGKLFGEATTRTPRELTLDLRGKKLEPAEYQRLKEQKEKGQLDAVYLADGRRLL